MILHWRLDGINYEWVIPPSMLECYRVWFAHLGTPNQYLDEYPRDCSYKFSSWIKAKEQLETAKRTLAALEGETTKNPSQRTPEEVLEERSRPGGGCCDRYCDNGPCDCLETAQRHVAEVHKTPGARGAHGA